MILLEKQPADMFLELENGGTMLLEMAGLFILEQQPWYLTLEDSFFDTEQ